jgi:hypothetical protein
MVTDYPRNRANLKEREQACVTMNRKWVVLLPEIGLKATLKWGGMKKNGKHFL